MKLYFTLCTWHGLKEFCCKFMFCIKLYFLIGFHHRVKAVGPKEKVCTKTFLISVKSSMFASVDISYDFISYITINSAKYHRWFCALIQSTLLIKKWNIHNFLRYWQYLIFKKSCWLCQFYSLVNARWEIIMRILFIRIHQPYQ